jgi:2-polyprenyl-3-methyl-5-hydroxy-6-metoxy-1,4-benzoquinol methylase
VSTLHELAIRDYTEHYARMNPAGLEFERVAKRTYRNMEVMYGPFVDGLAAGQAVLDVGCGTGFFLHWLSQRPSLRLWGVDACEGQAEYARRAAPAATIVIEDAIEFLDTQHASFGGVFCIDMLEHVQTDEDCFRLLQGVHESLEPNGFFICRVPNAAHILGSFSRYIDITHHRSFTSHSLRQAFAAAGFKDIRMIPHRSSSWLGTIRLGLEYLFHRMLFLFAGYSAADIYTQNVVAIGFKR